jgi:prolyl-tRNA editing enzyme YbaK/EbsC (Cys-tRNA(Pro) deacylase)
MTIDCELPDPVAAVVHEFTARGFPPSAVHRSRTPLKTAKLAARAVDADLGVLVNSLVFETNGTPLLVLASGAHRVDLDNIRKFLGANVSRASPGFVVEHTAQRIGGVAPTGHPSQLLTLLDDELSRNDCLWVGGGDEFTLLATTFSNLRALTSATVLSLRSARGSTPR